jgi:hypothetical protein
MSMTSKRISRRRQEKRRSPRSSGLISRTTSLGEFVSAAKGCPEIRVDGLAVRNEFLIEGTKLHATKEMQAVLERLTSTTADP